MKGVSDLVFFVQIVRSESFAAMATALGVTRSAVSRRLALIEKRLGVRLLNRTTRRMSITAEGERYFSQGRRILEDLDSLEKELIGCNSEPKGTLRVNASTEFRARLIGGVLSKFMDHYRNVAVECTLTDVLPTFSEDSFDIAIRYSEPADPKLLSLKLFSNPKIICAAPEYLSSHQVIHSPQDLSGHACLLVKENRDPCEIWLLQNHITAANVKVKVGGPLGSNDRELVIRWGVDGHGVVLCSSWDIHTELTDGSLVQILPEWYSVAADVFLWIPHHHPMTSKVRVFVDFVRGCLGQEVELPKRYQS